MDAIVKKYLDLARDSLDHDQEEIKYNDRTYKIHKGVFSPKGFNNSFFDVENIEIVDASLVGEMGCGAGIFAGESYHQGARKVFGYDIDYRSLENFLVNGIIQDIDFEIGKSDVFQNFKAPVDLLHWNMPYIWSEEPIKEKKLRALIDPDYKGIKEYITQGHEHLHKGGRLTFEFSPSVGNQSLLEKFIQESPLNFRVIAEKTVPYEDIGNIDFHIYEGT